MLKFDILITYQKPNGKQIQRYLKHFDYEIGYINQFGWKVVDIQYYRHGKFFTEETYHKIRKIEEYLRNEKNISLDSELLDMIDSSSDSFNI